MQSIASILEGIPKPATHPHRAVIVAEDQPTRHGCVADRCTTTGGIFWPDDGELLAQPIQVAVLEISGGGRFPICNVEQCPASRGHWNFDILEEQN